MGLIRGLLGGGSRRSASPFVQAFERGDDMPNAWGRNGRVITEPDALGVVAVYACVRVLAETVASLPLHLYRRLQPRGRERATAHPLYWILHARPNPEMDRMPFWEALLGHAALRGTAYAEIQRDRDARVTALWPLNPSKMAPDRTREGRLFWRYRLPDGAEKLYDRAEILNVPGFGSNGITGYSPIALHAEAIGLAQDTQTFASEFFRNDATPGGVLAAKDTLSDEAYARMKASWEDAHKGVGNAHRVAILEEGVCWQQIGLNSRDTQFIEQRRFSVEEAARLFRLPPHAIGDLSHATFSNIEHQGLELVTMSLRPWAERFEQAIERCLLTPLEQQTYYVEHLFDGLLRGDIQTRYAAYSISHQNGWNSANDIREMENQNPIPPDQGGDTYMVQLNMVPAGMLGETQGGGGGGDDAGQRALPIESRATGSAASRLRLADRYERLFRDAARRVVNREVAEVRTAARRHLLRRDAQSFQAWLRDYYQRFGETATRNLLGVMSTYGDAILEDAAAEIGSSDAMAEELAPFVQTYASGFGEHYAESSLAQLEDVLASAATDGTDQLDAIEKRLDEWAEKRPRKVASNETIRLAGALVLARWARGNIKRIRWVANPGKVCRFCRKLNGQVVGIEQAFADVGDEIEGGGTDQPLKVNRKTTHPPIHSFCRCGLQPERG